MSSKCFPKQYIKKRYIIGVNFNIKDYKKSLTAEDHDSLIKALPLGDIKSLRSAGFNYRKTKLKRDHDQ